MAAQCKLYRRENSVGIPANQWKVSLASWPGIVPVPGDISDQWPMSPGPLLVTDHFILQSKQFRPVHINNKGKVVEILELQQLRSHLSKLKYSKYFQEYWEYDVKWELMEHHPQIQPTVRLLMDHLLRVSETVCLSWMYPSASPASLWQHLTH